jgi:hypothetical protein
VEWILGGLEQLEALFENAGVNYWDLGRKTTV